MPKALFTICAFLLFSISASAARFNIAGQITDTEGKAVPFASIALSEIADSSVVQFAVSDENGKYAIRGVEQGTYYLVIASVGYEVKYHEIDINRDQKNVDISLAASTMSIEEVMVVAKKIPILLNGDTVMYNASSFKTQSNATVEDLIRKMPGIQVNKDGSVNVEGQTVTKVMINGKEFFGGNVEAATKNLDASLVDKVEVIDKKTDEDEFTGQDDSQREKVINLVLKEEHTQGYFGTLRGGLGDQNYYDGHGNINFFKDETQLSIIGGANNLNRRLYGWRAMQTLQSFEINPFNSNNRTMWWSGGIKSYNGVGANLHFEPIEGMKTDVAYVLTNEESTKIAESNSEVYLTDNTLFSDSREQANGTRNQHQINSKVEFEPDTLNRFVFRGQFNTSADAATNMSRTFNFIDTESILNSGVDRDNVESGDYKVVTKLHWTRKMKLKKENHFLGSVYYDQSELSNAYSSYFNTVDSFLLPIPNEEASLLDQKLTTAQQTVATTSAYQIVLSKKWTIRPGFNWMRSTYEHDFRWIPAGAEEIPEQSPVGQVTAQNMEYFMHIRYQLDSFTNIYFVPEINQTIEERTFTTDTTASYSFNQKFFIPFMWIRSQKAHKYDFRFNFRASVRKPQVAQIIPVRDNSNPYVTKVGAIDLQNYINYNNGWHYRRFFGLGKSVSIGGWTSFSLKPIVNSNTITEDNYSVAEYLNYKDHVYSNHDFSFNWPVAKLKATLGLEIEYDFNRSYFIQNKEDVLSLNSGYSIGPRIQLNEFDKVSLDLRYLYTWKQGSIGGVENNPFGYHEVDAEFIWTPIDRVEWSSELYWELFGSNSTVGQLSIPIWSSSFSVFIDKEQKWSLGVRAYDILDKNQNVWRWWSANRFVENRTNTITRYVMGTVTYKIKKPTPKKDVGGPVDKRR